MGRCKENCIGKSFHTLFILGLEKINFLFFRLSQQLAITEFEFGGFGHRPVVREQLLDISLSPEAIKEREALQNIDRLLSKKASAKVCAVVPFREQQCLVS